MSIPEPAGPATPAVARPEANVLRRWLPRVGVLLLVVGSAWPAPLFRALSLTFTGDRLLGLAAVPTLALLVLAGRLRWTCVHTALAAFVAAQIATTALNARVWSPGPKLVTVYVLGFACFALAAECGRGADARRWMVGAWLAVAAIVSIIGTINASLANFYQQQWQGPWETGVVQVLFDGTPWARTLFAPRVTFDEWNLFSTFLLIPLALGLWRWRRDGGGQTSLVAAVGAIVFGLVSGVTRSAWLAMAGIMALWCWKRRPRGRQVAALGLMLAAALTLQALALGASPLWQRAFERSNIAARSAINRSTAESWLEQPIVGHGAGATTRLTVVVGTNRIEKVWNGNLELFVLHNSGVLGLATLLGLVVVVWRRALRALRGPSANETASLTTALLVGGSALGFAYQFTHGLWIMYPYVCLGFLTAVTEPRADGA